MDWQTPEDAVPSAFVTESNRRAISAKPPASGAWRIGDDPGDRLFQQLGPMEFERGGSLREAVSGAARAGDFSEQGERQQKGANLHCGLIGIAFPFIDFLTVPPILE